MSTDFLTGLAAFLFFVAIFVVIAAITDAFGKKNTPTPTPTISI